MNAKHLGLALLMLSLSACGSDPYAPVIRIRPPEVPQWAPAKLDDPNGDVFASANESETGLASWYGVPFHGRRTANGEIFNRHAMTAAHPFLPLGTDLEVTNLKTGRSVTLRVNDRFPGRPGYVIDVSQAAAIALGFERAGRTQVALKPVEDG